ncbi:MAG TPA: DEAD/DEAH box helicase [Candidatus Tyrphobacter sp.]
MIEELHPLVGAWFSDRYGEPTEPQRRGWPLIRAGNDVLICAPTGSGKTLAAFSICLDDLVRRADGGELPDATLVLYVSPLKALSNDVRKNLELPLRELQLRAVERGVPLATIRTAVRTGDTTTSERARMLRTPPHVLVTTPESLFILLTAEKSRRLFAGVTTVIVDEIHAMAGDKRGSHLALTLARLDDLVAREGGKKPQRIGLSATVRPIEDVARFLSESAQIVDVGSRREMNVRVEVPADELGAVASTQMWSDIYDRVAEQIRTHRTTLVFVGTRRMSERAAFALTERLGEGVLLPHHGSLSREARFEAERRLKGGELRAVVATASLELGIDIGSIDLVVQLGTPRAICVGLQRIGRSGHWVGAIPKGTIYATTRDELLECAALVRAIRSGAMDALAIPSAPLDILAQQIVAASSEHEWGVEELYALVRSTYPYRNLTRADFEAVLSMLGDGIATSRGRSGTWVHHDRVNGRLRPRRGARLTAITCGGAIPDNANYAVVVEPEGQTIGTLDEDFAIESMAGDIFLLGTNSWKIRRIEAGVVRVEDAHGAPPSIPFWNGEGLGRTIELSREVCAVREEIDRSDDAQAQAFLRDECGLDDAGAQQATAYVRAGKAALGALPTAQTVVAERFFDEAGGMQLILHTPFGARINRAWGLTLRKRFCRSFNLELQAAATDNGVLLSLSDQHAFPLEIVFEFVKSASVQSVLTQALLPAPMFAARWRWNATRSLAILRRSGGRKVPPQILRMRADDLLAATFPDQAACPENLSGPIRIPDHVLVRETIDNCLREAMDVDGLVEILRALESGAIRTVAIDTPEPSPFCHEILNANPYAFLDDAPLEERRARAVQVRRTLRDDGEAGILDPEAIAQVTRESWPLVRDADELHDALATLVVVPPIATWEEWFGELVSQNRASALVHGSLRFWVCAERLTLAQRAYGGVGDVEAVTEILRGWLESAGPTTVSELCATLCLDPSDVEAALLALETEGQVLRGRFRSQRGPTAIVAVGARRDVEAAERPKQSVAPGAAQRAAPLNEWCNRRVLARIHRLTIGTLRREIEPVSIAEYVRFLYRWQHATPSSRLHGIDGTLHVIRQLEGYEIPAAAWEAQVLPARIAGYRPEYLDRLCYSGDVMWGRLSPHPALAPGDDERRRVRPTKLAPIALFARESAEELIARPTHDPTALSHVARDVLAQIEARGAPFFGEIVRGTKHLPSEVEEALWQLVAAGLVTADGFDALRSLVDAKRRLGEKGHRARPRSSGGRWTLLVPATQRVDACAFALRLLARWGVLCRDVTARESLAPPWRELLPSLRRMEARGEVRGGHFVAGIGGEQFALPEALDALRAARRGDEWPLTEDVGVGTYDPLQLAGVILPLSQSASAEVVTSGSSSIGR